MFKIYWLTQLKAIADSEANYKKKTFFTFRKIKNSFVLNELRYYRLTIIVKTS